MMDKTMQQKLIEESKKKRKYIILLCLTIMVIVLIIAQNVQKTEETSQKDAAISCVESIIEQQNIIQIVLEEHKADQAQQTAEKQQSRSLKKMMIQIRMFSIR